jgi:hypothetical protein
MFRSHRKSFYLLGITSCLSLVFLYFKDNPSKGYSAVTNIQHHSVSSRQPSTVPNASKPESMGAALPPPTRSQAVAAAHVLTTLNQLNAELAKASGGKEEAFEEIKNEFSEKFATELQNMAFLSGKTPTFVEVPLRLTSATRELFSQGKIPGRKTMLALQLLAS